MKTRNQILTLSLCLCLLINGAGCAARVAPKNPAALVVSSPLDQLHSDLDRFFSDPNFDDAFWGVEIVSLDRGDLLYERNSTKLVMPASNNKVLTAAAALVRLGPDYRFETRVYAEGKIDNGILRGNLVVVGGGDPCLSSRFLAGDPFADFKGWAEQLKSKGIRGIEGSIIGDNRAFGDQQLGYGWEYDDLPYGYAAPVSALQFNENLLTLEIAPGAREGDPVKIKAEPLSDYLTIESRAVTSPAGAESEIEVTRLDSGEAIVASGKVAAGGKPVSQSVAVRNPAGYFLTALEQILRREGITVRKPAGGTESKVAPAQAQRELVIDHFSPPLQEILKPLLKVSQNLIAETLARALGMNAGGEGSFVRGKGVVEETLGRMGIVKGTYSYADGSGLSRHNLISADLMIRILRYMYRHKNFEQFYAALPIGGVDGTIAGRMKGTRAENNVHAKTGSIAKVRSLSGYVKTADGEMLAFSMIANNFLVPSKAAEYVQDTALERLAGFSRR